MSQNHSVLTTEERDWLRTQVHTDAMKCRQCQLVLRLINADEEEKR